MAYTLADLRQYIQDTHNLDKTDTKAVRVCDRIINSALRLGAQAYDWEWFNKTGRINTSEQQTSGTVAVTEDSAQVVLTGGTWPTGAVGMKIRISGSDTDHEIGTRNSATTATFVSGQVWNEATDATATYVLYKDRYSLAGDCRKFGALKTEKVDWALLYTDYNGWLEFKIQSIDSDGDPTVCGHDDRYIYLWPPPSEKKAIDYPYERWPASATTAGDTIDWPTQRIDVLYGLCGLMADVHRGKMAIDEALRRAKMLAWTMAADDAKYQGTEFVRPMGMGSGPYINPEFAGT